MSLSVAAMHQEILSEDAGYNRIVPLNDELKNIGGIEIPGVAFGESNVYRFYQVEDKHRRYHKNLRGHCYRYYIDFAVIKKRTCEIELEKKEIT